MSIRRNIKLVDPNMAKIFIPWVLKHPSYLFTARKLIKSFKSTVELRKRAQEEGLKVPPFLILSITKQCNLL